MVCNELLYLVDDFCFRVAQGFSQLEQGGDGWLVDAPFGQETRPG